MKIPPDIKQQIEDHYIIRIKRNPDYARCLGCDVITSSGKLEHRKAYGSREICDYIFTLKLLRKL